MRRRSRAEPAMKTGGRSPSLPPPSPPLAINRNNLEASARLRLLLPPPPPPPLPFSPLARRRLAATRIAAAAAAPRPQQRSPPPRAERPRRPHHHWCGMAEVAACAGQLIGVAVATLLAAIFLAAALLGRRRRAPLAGKPAAVDGCGVADGEGCGGDDRTDVIVVGAGVAGSALAYTLGKDGRRLHVIERDMTEPDRIVGELLQPGGYLKLMELGLEDGRNTKLSYPLEKFHSDVAGRSFHNGRFIQKMRQKAASLPNVHLEQGTVTSLLEEGGTVKGVQYKTKSGEELKAYAPLTIVCDGCFSNLRRVLCSPKVDVPSCFVGLVLENCQLPHPNHGHVILANPSPILCYLISSTEIRSLVDILRQKVPSMATGEMAKYLKTVVAPQIPPELHDSFIAAIDKGSIRTMPNRSMPAAPLPTPGALLMGDAFNMRHPLTGPLRNLHDASSLCKYLESFYTLWKPVASTINTLAGALYKVFCASTDQAKNEMREACFDYLSLGGVFSNGPIALLSGLNPQPLSLVAHFFAVGIYGVGRLMLPVPSPKRMWIGARLGACGIIFPIIKAEGVRQMFFPATVPAYYRAPPPMDQIRITHINAILHRSCRLCPLISELLEAEKGTEEPCLFRHRTLPFKRLNACTI
uniref:squalene monooxygenase n=1 Tax=Oryza meridionalis TaxID=40149 RepID=A0A0E0CXJ2_9ORYZ